MNPVIMFEACAWRTVVAVMMRNKIYDYLNMGRIYRETKYFFNTVIKLVFLYSIRYILVFLPHRFSVFVAKSIGVLSQNGQQAKIIENELGSLLGGGRSSKEFKKIAIESISNYKMDLFEIWSFPRLNKNRIDRIVSVEGLENVDKALEKGNGVLIGLSHFGSWKIVIPALAYKGYEVHQVGLDPRYFIDKKKPPHHNIIMEMEHKSEQSLPVHFIYIGKFLRDIFRALENNNVVIISLDGFMGSRKIEMPFFNSLLTLSAGPLMIAQRSKAPLLPVFPVRQKDNRPKVIVHEEIPIHTDKNKDQAVRNSLECYIKLLEHYVNTYPSHYGRILYDRYCDPDR